MRSYLFVVVFAFVSRVTVVTGALKAVPELPGLDIDKTKCVPGAHNASATEELEAPASFTVRWRTSASIEDEVVVEVIRAWSPLGADRFYQLARDNYFNCAAFFRVVPDFVVQFGIASQPTETTKWEAPIQDDPVTQSNAKGTLTFATAGPNTRTTQLFINLADNDFLDDEGFSPIGRVVEGLDVIEKSIHNPTPGSSSGADQEEYTELGNKWILKEYPNIDIIVSSELVEE